MKHPAKRYLFALIAFVVTVAFFTAGIGATLAGLAVAAAVLYADRLAPLVQHRPARVSRRRVAANEPYQLVPDEPSLILSPEG